MTQLIVQKFGFSVADQVRFASEPAAVQLLIRRAPDSEAMYRAFFNSPLEDTKLVEWFAPADPATYPQYRQAVRDWVAAYRKYFHTINPLPEHASFLKDRPWESQ